jgi:hypothetical protein
MKERHGMQAQNSSKRVRRLANYQYRAIEALGLALHNGETWTPAEYKVTSDDERERIMRDVEALADELGLNHARLSYEKTFTESLKLLGGDEGKHPLAHSLYNLALEIRRRGRNVKSDYRDSPLAKTAPTTAHVAKDDHSRERFGLMPDDNLTLEECDDLRAGETVLLWDKEGGTWDGVMRFVEYEEDGEWGRAPRLYDGTTSEIYNPAAYHFYRITSITRTIEVKRPDENGEDVQTKQKIQRLRDRLSRMDADDITDSSARMKLETEIYNLEHPSKLDDWSAWEEA